MDSKIWVTVIIKGDEIRVPNKGERSKEAFKPKTAENISQNHRAQHHKSRLLSSVTSCSRPSVSSIFHAGFVLGIWPVSLWI